MDKELFPNWCIVTSEDNLTEGQMLQKMKDENNQLEKKFKEDNLTEEEIKQKMKENGKERVLFLTGLKGGTGSTYNTCSLTIHFDNSSSPEQYMQHLYRGATPKEGHQYFFTFDMNIHRSFEYQYKFTEDLYDCFKEKKTREQCYLYAREYDLLRFNPPEHCPEFKELSTEERKDIYKKDWCNIDSSMILHKFSTQFKLPTSTDNQIDMDLINQLFPLLLPFISDSVFNFLKNTDDKETDDENNDNPNENIRPKQKNRKVGTRDKKEKENHIPTDKEKEQIVVKFCELFFNHISFWMFINQISLDEIFEIEELVFEILGKFIDLEKFNNSSLNKENLIDIMKKISRLNPKILDSLQRVYKNKHFKKIREELEKMLIVSEKEKNERGFVITPSFLAEKMVSKIPTDFWKKERLTLDPCCGYGIFPLLVFELFNKHLPIRNKEKRVRIIIEKCIFFSDISSYNVKITKQLLQFHCDKVVGKKVEGLKFNCWVGDTLKLDYKRKFDLVIGNPPYQKRVGPNKTEPIWNLFVDKSLSLLNKDGYMVLVHPSGWRDVQGKFNKTKKLIMSKNILYLNMNDYKEGLKIFKCGTNFDYYVIQNNNQYKSTEINDIDGKKNFINLKRWNFIPSGELNTYNTLIAKSNEPKCNVLYDRSMYGNDKKNISKEKTDIFRYACVYTITMKDGLKCIYSSEKKGHFNIPKVIWSSGGGTYPIVDMKGQYGLSNFAYAIVDEKKNLKDIEKVLNNRTFLKLMEYVKITQNNKYNGKVISLFKKDWYKQFL
jgi:hypothetical protein